MQELSQYNFKIQYPQGKERGKPDALTRTAGDPTTAGNKILTGKVGILQPKGEYWVMEDAEEMMLNMLETIEFQHKDEGGIQGASKIHNEI